MLNAFLNEDAADDARNLYSVTHLAKYHGEIVGFFTLITDNINVDRIESSEYADYQYRKLPAVKIARLATARKYERKGVGKMMIFQIFRIVNMISHFAGCRIITVDAKEDALGFYQKYAFKEVKSKKNLTYVPMYLDFKYLREKM
ncbi:MAG TPA: GNAT family N-acetyltransferase [Methanocorpusculum sp.]|nr:GNAT family N-acetyltransferase [Methanocorpusculum sp.]